MSEKMGNFYIYMFQNNTKSKDLMFENRGYFYISLSLKNLSNPQITSEALIQLYR